MERKLNSGNACYNSVQNLPPSRLLSENVKIRIYETNFACGSIWVWNLVSDTKGGRQTESAWEKGADDDILTEEGWSDRRVEKTA
jgi:hypothetical protein